MAILILMPQIVLHSTIVGSDAMFHFNRIYDSAKQIQNLNFSYFQTSYGFQQSGRIINGLYGPYFSYLGGILLILVRTWYNFEIVTTLCIYVLGGSGMYLLARYAHSSNKNALFVSLLFMSIGWLPRWGLAQNFNAWGAALAPYVLICAIHMIQNRQRPIKIIPLALIMAIIIQTHILSSIIFITVLIPFFIVGWLRADKKIRVWRDLGLSMLLTVMLTANIWGSFLTIFATNQIAKPAQFNLANNALQVMELNNGRSQLGIVCLILFTIQIIYVLFNRNAGLTNRVVTIVGTVFLVLSSELFPWRLLQRQIPILENTLQFPARLTIMAYPLLLCGLAITLSQVIVHYRPRTGLVVSLATIAIVFCTVPNFFNMVDRSMTFKSSTVLNSWKGITLRTDSPHKVRGALESSHPGKVFRFVEKRHPDYLPVPPKAAKENFKRTKAYENQVIKQQNKFNHQVLQGGRIKLTWNADQKGKRQLPLIVYKESYIKLNGNQLKHKNIRRTNIGALIVNQQVGKNTVVMRFRQPVTFTYLLILSLVSWILVAVFGIYKMCKKNNTKIE
ncbi:6-pyruvoyl-tetrahydropterin synthase-related protein [Paucilactobacillus kaifaensis]|uniref:6-pyruvoyl-tetrahydropterin synthase-related protein n=1 Tax=Paucilactobacillus kaifaensis TaxID=2559921 RepID=UPI0010F482EF|nr:6-pyruvoyl-tetrahydropterin synthase-related protein [Paucilactobacillus kaifaensis]